jgi:tetratricopeptide (TPR) repeat protein
MVKAEDIMASKDPEGVMRMASEFFDQIINATDLKDSRVVAGMRDGLTPAQAMGMTRDELSALYAMGFHKLNAGENAQAQDVFTWLCMIDPLHAPNLYCLGIALQLQGKMVEATDCFLRFLALDATNPVGYLRYGECKLAMGDGKAAREAFELAEAECLNGHGDEITLAEARGRLAALKEQGK